jgi:hypothetical protein
VLVWCGLCSTVALRPITLGTRSEHDATPAARRPSGPATTADITISIGHRDADLVEITVAAASASHPATTAMAAVLDLLDLTFAVRPRKRPEGGG